jgi:hypothetical protein
MDEVKAEEKPKVDFRKGLVKKVYVQIEGVEYPLKRFTMEQELLLKEQFGEDLEEWRKKLSSLDTTCLLQSLHFFLEPNDMFKTWKDIAKHVDCQLEERMNMHNAITFCILAAVPEAQEAVKKKTEEIGLLLKNMIREKLTGLGSSINSSLPTDGNLPTSSALP